MDEIKMFKEKDKDCLIILKEIPIPFIVNEITKVSFFQSFQNKEKRIKNSNEQILLTSAQGNLMFLNEDNE